MERPASSTVEAFTLSADDPRVHQARLDLSTKTRLKLEQAQRAPTDWGRCQGRHAKARFDEQLGPKRPSTAWTESGTTALKDGSWRDWGACQTERVLDLNDINTIRQGAIGIDAFYKSFVWNLSQNVDRTTGSNAAAISPCLTPNMIAYLTTRGGPIIGLEALSLQGLPIEKLLLTRETEDQLANLAGNAMTSTVVGACMVAALVVAQPLFADERKRLAKAKRKAALMGEEVMEVDAEDEGEELGAEARAARTITQDVVGETHLLTQPLDLSETSEIAIATVLEHAARSARHCSCEGQSDLVDPQVRILRCRACGHSACEACKGRPLHEYVPSTTSSDRIQPREFGDQLRAMIPTRVTFAGVDGERMEELRAQGEQLGVSIADSDWALFRPSVLSALEQQAEYRFKWVRRRDTWSLQMGLAEQAYLELDLDPNAPTWYLFVLPDKMDANKSRRRQLFQPPVGRMPLDRTGSSVLAGEWQIALPSTNTFSITLKGCGPLQPSWKNSLGLVAFQNEMVHSEIEVSVPTESKHFFDIDVSGRYYAHADCGTAQDSLYIRPATAKQRAVSFFLDPTRSETPNKDAFVFASRSERLEYGETRAIYGSIDPRWRPTQLSVDIKTSCTVVGRWIAMPDVSLGALTSRVALVGEETGSATVSIPSAKAQLSWTADSCEAATAVLALSVPIVHPEREPELWHRGGGWGQIDLALSSTKFQEDTAWIMERLPEMAVFRDWSEVECAHVIRSTEPTCCPRCAPPAPEVGWIMSGGKLIPMEDPAEAGRFEWALKHRPAPFAIQARLDGHVGQMKIGLNVASLLHRAFSLLPPKPNLQHTLTWRLLPNHPSVESTIYLSKEFFLPSNKLDPDHLQPPSFKRNGHKLRPEQLRSFGWAMRQERPELEYTFEEEEIAEATLAPLGWRAEGKASRKVLVRGGVIADAVGYGKTAIALAVIDASRKLPSLAEDARSVRTRGLLPTKATLVVVPGHLMDQWAEEAAKFLGDEVVVRVFRSFTDMNKITIRQYQETDILIVSTSLFSARFWETLSEFSAAGEIPSYGKDGRFFRDRFKECCEGIKDQVELLTSKPTEGSPSKNIRQVGQNVKDGIALNAQRRKEAAASKAKLIRIGQHKLSGASYDAHYNPVKTKEENKEEAQIKKEKSRVVDPFGLTDTAVFGDYKKLKCAPLHAFQFERLVVDEFTYVEGRARAAIKALSSHSTWVLSGTPNIEDFDEINESV